MEDERREKEVGATTPYDLGWREGYRRGLAEGRSETIGKIVDYAHALHDVDARRRPPFTTRKDAKP